jgi:hypothetical protein
MGAMTGRDSQRRQAIRDGTRAGKEIEYPIFKICAMGAGMLCLRIASLVHGIPRCVRNDALSLL